MERQYGAAIALLESGASANVVISEMTPLLIVSATYPDIKMITTLLAHKADPNAEMDNKQTSMHLVAKANEYREPLNLTPYDKLDMLKALLGMEPMIP